MKGILDKIEVEDLPTENLQRVAKTIGISNLKVLMLKCGGMVLHIPKTYSKIYYRKYIEKNWNGKNAKKIASDLGVTERTVHRHLNAKL